jgi:hypothetical protein
MPQQTQALVLYTAADKQLVGPIRPRRPPRPPRWPPWPPSWSPEPPSLPNRMPAVPSWEQQFEQLQDDYERLMQAEGEWGGAEQEHTVGMIQEQQEGKIVMRKERKRLRLAKKSEDAGLKTVQDADRRCAEREEASVQRATEQHLGQRSGWDQWAVDNNESFHMMMEDKARMSMQHGRFLRGNSDPRGSQKWGPLRNFMKN